MPVRLLRPRVLVLVLVLVLLLVLLAAAGSARRARVLVCLDSKNEPMLQLLDVTLGPLTAYRNGRHLRPDASNAKSELAVHAVTALGIKDLTKNQDAGRWFSIWNVVPRKQARPSGLDRQSLVASGAPNGSPQRAISI
jgi:hypothetical protein